MKAKATMRKRRSVRSLDSTSGRKAKEAVGEKEKEKADVREVAKDHSGSAGDLVRKVILNALNHGHEDTPITRVDKSYILPKCRTRRNT